MAKLNSEIGFTGTLGNLSAYRMKGSDKIILRTKGGATKNQISTHPNFELTRQNNAEFGACSKAGTQVRKAMPAVMNLGDFNCSGKLNAIARSIQKLDTTSLRGQRGIAFSRYHHLLDGFSLNKNLLFNTVLRSPVPYGFNRGAGAARAIIPELLPGINLHTPFQYSLYRFVLNLGVLTDVNRLGNGFEQPAPAGSFPVTVYSGWASPKERMASQTIDLQLAPFTALRDDQCLLLSIGIQFGEPVTRELINPVKGTGAGVVLGTG